MLCSVDLARASLDLTTDSVEGGECEVLLEPLTRTFFSRVAGVLASVTTRYGLSSTLPTVLYMNDPSLAIEVNAVGRDVEATRTIRGAGLPSDLLGEVELCRNA